ncbi:MAG: thioredoxin domain-containing protein [Candidatus Omnitrophica bacterium]|nr:thioredoxin domain-containing protein [Candidatus Omnitrophota bacterium]
MQPSRGAAWYLGLSLIGLGLSGYLVFVHLGLMRGELLGGTACSAAGSAFNCHAVASGPWSAVLGMPLALWGVLGYLTAFALALWARQPGEAAAHGATLLFLLAALFVAIDIALFTVMAVVIRVYCLFCLLTYAVNAGLLVVSARSLPFPWPRAFARAGASLGWLLPSARRTGTEFFWGLLLVSVLGVTAFHLGTTYAAHGSLAGSRKQIQDFIAHQPRVRVETAGDPSVGPAGAPLELAEFSDFFCPSCQRAFQMNAIVLATHRRDLRFIFKHYPLDTACNGKISRMVHPGACRVAAASECAHLQGKFWPFHDVVFAEGHRYNLNRLESDVRRLGMDPTAFEACMASGQGMEAVKRDIEEAAKLNVQSTPTYVLNGIVITGGFTPSVFEEFVSVLKEYK